MDKISKCLSRHAKLYLQLANIKGKLLSSKIQSIELVKDKSRKYKGWVGEKCLTT